MSAISNSDHKSDLHDSSDHVSMHKSLQPKAKATTSLRQTLLVMIVQPSLSLFEFLLFGLDTEAVRLTAAQRQQHGAMSEEARLWT